MAGDASGKGGGAWAVWLVIIPRTVMGLELWLERETGAGDESCCRME